MRTIKTIPTLTWYSRWRIPGGSNPTESQSVPENTISYARKCSLYRLQMLPNHLFAVNPGGGPYSALPDPLIGGEGKTCSPKSHSLWGWDCGPWTYFLGSPVDTMCILRLQGVILRGLCSTNLICICRSPSVIQNCQFLRPLWRNTRLTKIVQNRPSILTRWRKNCLTCCSASLLTSSCLHNSSVWRPLYVINVKKTLKFNK